MEPGITYRVNLSPRKGCVSIGVYPPATRSFGSGRRVVFRECGGYFTLTPGPDRGGAYSLLVSAPRGTEAVVGYHLQAAAAQPDDQGPGVPLSSDARVSGSLSGRASTSSTSTASMSANGAPSRQPWRPPPASSSLSRDLDGTPIADATPGSTLRETLERGTYLLAVTAPGRIGGNTRWHCSFAWSPRRR